MFASCVRSILARAHASPPAASLPPRSPHPYRHRVAVRLLPDSAKAAAIEAAEKAELERARAAMKEEDVSVCVCVGGGGAG